MFGKLVAAFVLVAVSVAVAVPWGEVLPHRGLTVGSPLLGAANIGTGLEYPAGVTPADCPNFPFCDEHYFNPATRTADVGTRRVLNVGSPLLGAATIGTGLEYPASVTPADCPNFPFCDERFFNPATRTADVETRRVLNVGICPNYPYCL